MHARLLTRVVVAAGLLLLTGYIVFGLLPVAAPSVIVPHGQEHGTDQIVIDEIEPGSAEWTDPVRESASGKAEMRVANLAGAGYGAADMRSSNAIIYDEVPLAVYDQSKPSRVIVMGKLQEEDTSWVAKNLPDWQTAIYTVDNTSAALHTPRNKGREANVYLLYVITHYDDLPETIVFIHPHRKGWPAAWHTDWAGHDMVGALKALKTDFIQRNGYANLRCQWEPGCPDAVQYKRAPEDPDPDRFQDHHMEELWHRFFGKASVVPETIATPCCAQFAVSRSQVQQRPREEYIKYHQWLMETEYTDDFSGRMLEYLWHVIFGQDPVYCPSPTQCYIDVYGR